MPLTSPLLLVILAVVAEALLFVALRRQSVRSKLTRIGSGGLAFVLVLAGGAAWTNDHFGLYRSWHDLLGVSSTDLVTVADPTNVSQAVTALPPGERATHGTLVEVRIPGPVSGVKPRSAFVYLPPQYRESAYAARTFPVIEAFQGSPGRPSDWILSLHLDKVMDDAIAAGQVEPAIVVMPDTNAGVARSLECTNTADGQNDETFLTTDVRSWMQSQFRVPPARWTAVGYSTGGYCSLMLSVRHPQSYSAAISLDGYSHALSDHYARGLWHSPQDRLDHSPDYWIAHHKPEKVDMYVLAGRDDADSLRDATHFWDVLARTGWKRPHDLLVAQPQGRHTFPAWQAALSPALQWALPGPNGQLGTVLVGPPQAEPVPVRSGLGHHEPPVVHGPVPPESPVKASTIVPAHPVRPAPSPSGSANRARATAPSTVNPKPSAAAVP